jgi:hydroxyacylglutathione hydrolase
MVKRPGMIKIYNAPRLRIRTCQVGPWGLNAYALVCSESRKSVLIDPGAEPEALERMLAESDPVAILLTHTHSDHTGALAEMRKTLKVPVMAHPGDEAHPTNLDADQWLHHGSTVNVGSHQINVYHTPGHSADQISFMLEDHHAAMVGDTIFQGGPGKTWSAEEFQITLKTLRKIVLPWPDETICYPGHGPGFCLGDMRKDIEKFLNKNHGSFFGDATWDM